MLNIEQKEDSAEKLASVQGKPTKYYLFSQEFNAIVQKINEVYLGQNPNRITGLGTETVEGNQYTYQGYSWIINCADLDNIDTPSVIVIPTASVGFRRKDISVFNEFGNIVRVPGIETDGDIATTPDVPENTIYFRTYDVVGDVITSDETPPFVGIEYKSKRESDSYTYDNAGENVILPLPGEGQSHLIVENEDIVSIDGFDKSILILVRNGEYPYEGKDFLFENKSPNPVQLNHLTSAEIPSILPNEENVVVPSGGSIWFKFKGEQMAYIMKSWNDPVDLSTKADLVGGKVPAEQLPAYVDDVLEFANLASFPVTGETGKIYLALDTNKTYRWSGSAYVQLSAGIDFPVDGKTYGVKDGLAVDLGVNILNEFPNSIIIQASGAGVSYLGTYAQTFTGTQSDFLVSGGGVAYRKVVSAATAGSNANMYDAGVHRVQPGIGFYYRARIKNEDATNIATGRFSYGFSGTAIMGNINPSTYTQALLSLGADNTDSNCQIFYKNSSGGVNKIDLGVTMPKTQLDEYIVEFLRHKGSTTIYYKITNLTTGVVILNSFTFGLNVLALGIFRNNETVASACGFAMRRVELYIGD